VLLLPAGGHPTSITLPVRAVQRVLAVGQPMRPRPSNAPTPYSTLLKRNTLALSISSNGKNGVQACAAAYLSIMGKTKDKQHAGDRHILTHASGRPTHVILTIEAYERIADLVEEADDVLEVERRMQDADFLSLEEVKTSLGLHDPD
jgi:hypothetical protein